MTTTIPLEVEHAPGIFSFVGPTLIATTDTPTATPGFTDSRRLIRGDKITHFKFNWNIGGFAAGLPGTFEAKVIFEEMGPGEFAGCLFSAPAVPNAGVVGNPYSATVNIGPGIPDGIYRVTCLLSYLEAGVNPTPIVAFAELSMVRVYSSALVA